MDNNLCAQCHERPINPDVARVHKVNVWTDEVEDDQGFCSDDCAQEYEGEYMENMEFCHVCERQIDADEFLPDPSDGQLSPIVQEYVCRRCFQRWVLEHGITRKQIEDFFAADENGCLDTDDKPMADNYDHGELREKGWTERGGIHFSSEDIDELERELLKYADAGLMLVALGGTVICGPELFTIWTKPRAEKVEVEQPCTSPN